MGTVFTKTMNWGGRPLVLETGHMARHANGAVLAKYGDTVVLCTVVAHKEASADASFFPLGVHYQEKYYAAGRIPGGFLKREGRPSERETLVSRLIDRPIRPLFPEGFKNETQVICTVLSHDLENSPDIVALIGASAALTLSGIPFLGPIGGARVGYINGEYVLNPLLDDMSTSRLDLIVAGTHEGVLMVESEAQELPEEIMLGAVEFGHKAFLPVIDLIIELAEEAAKEPWALIEMSDSEKELREKVKKLSEKSFEKAYKIKEKNVRKDEIDRIRTDILNQLEDEEHSAITIGDALKATEHTVMRSMVLDTKKRIDGRDTVTVRPISCGIGVLPRAHGSALFTRGETQVLSVSTLGTGEDEQLIDLIEGEIKEPFMLHYNFPPFSVGETGRIGSPGRREVGHGKLAWRAIHPLLPSKDDFPYTLRAVAEVLESNGSSSMATVCATSLALMDAGVPLKGHIAGIAMGLIKEGKNYAVLTDILGAEDALGDMDFKVAGTRSGITALQMDIKITSITHEIMNIALRQALEARLHIIAIMEQAISGSRSTVNDNAPQIKTIKIPKDKIREVIGTGGKVIRDICETTGVKIDIEDDGTVRVAALDGQSIELALKRIYDITAEAEVGKIYTGKVVKIVEFGAFIDFLNTSGLVHISEIDSKRIEKVEDVLSLGDEVQVKVIGIDDRGKVRLSIKATQQGNNDQE
ncbi:MAG: polyribonucleotide nucleotidyltransferase [Alphaproteobacteria bacterium RIFCSPLOWO2_01_FULL_45_8]|nr:MAG: polyribonucleotide nucleotidyltransferase [Alphaproteobacteria bacterium RIFCSPLOWO2_01_FULL_45_8]